MIRRGSLMRARSAPSGADELRRGERRPLFRHNAVGEAPAQALLEVGEVGQHDLARALRIVPPHRLDDLLMRFLRRAARSLVAEVADRGDEQLAIRLDGRLEHLVARRARELDVEVHARVRVRDRLAAPPARPRYALTPTGGSRARPP